MSGFLVRVSVMLAACFALGGCVGYGFPGDYGNGYGNPYGYGSQQPYPGNYGGRTFRCESQDRRMRRCNVDTRYGISISRRLSDAPCIQGRTWGYDRNGVWVDNGCRAEFTIGGGYGGGSSYPGGGYGQGRTIRCESQDKRLRHCNVNVNRGVQLQRKLSDSSCNRGSDWGWDRNGIWVDHGCRADFLVY